MVGRKGVRNNQQSLHCKDQLKRLGMLAQVTNPGKYDHLLLQYINYLHMWQYFLFSHHYIVSYAETHNYMNVAALHNLMESIRVVFAAIALGS